MRGKARAPGWHVSGYRQSLGAIDRFEAAYLAYLETPDVAHRSVAESYLVGAAIACDTVGAVPGHARLDKWGVAALAFAHENPASPLVVRDTAGPVRAALHSARRSYLALIEVEQRKRRNPLRWAAYGLGVLALVPLRLAQRLRFDGQGDPIPLPLVILAGLVSFIAVAGVTITLLT